MPKICSNCNESIINFYYNYTGGGSFNVDSDDWEDGDNDITDYECPECNETFSYDEIQELSNDEEEEKEEQPKKTTTTIFDI